MMWLFRNKTILIVSTSFRIKFEVRFFFIFISTRCALLLSILKFLEINVWFCLYRMFFFNFENNLSNFNFWCQRYYVWLYHIFISIAESIMNEQKQKTFLYLNLVFFFTLLMKSQGFTQSLYTQKKNYDKNSVKSNSLHVLLISLQTLLVFGKITKCVTKITEFFS
jgi:hypothetical protein